MLERAERYASPKFRRFARSFDPYRVDYEDAVELVAFLDLVPVASAKYVFGWTPYGQESARKLSQHVPVVEGAEPLAEANRRLVSLTDGLRVLSAMQDGGWTGGRVPDVVSMAVKGLRKDGKSLMEIAQALGVTHEQAKTMARVRSGKPMAGLGPLFAP
jgi:hypothetical protein